MILGRFDEAKKILDQWRQKGSLNSYQRRTRYRIAFIENDAATMERLARETPGDDVQWLHLQMQLAFLRGDFRKLRSLSETLVKQQGARTGWKTLPRACLACRDRILCSETLPWPGSSAAKRERRVNESALGLGTCAKALAHAGDVTQAEALAEKLDQLRPEDTFQQKVLCRSSVPSSSAARRLRQSGGVARATHAIHQTGQFLIIVGKLTWLQGSTPRLPPSLRK